MAQVGNGMLDGFAVNCATAKRIFTDLLASVNLEHGGEGALTLQTLYTFIVDEIARASAGQDRARLAQLLPLVATLREAWNEHPPATR
jgi:flagellar protein FliS